MRGGLSWSGEVLDRVKGSITKSKCESYLAKGGLGVLNFDLGVRGSLSWDRGSHSEARGGPS